MTKLQYRPEIDGLRAIAVLAVILYHAEFLIFGVNPFKGGFIGVDIFFVISGYLITSIILRERAENRFKLSEFYIRRARRILPALCAVMLATLPFAWALLLPIPLKEYAGSALSALGFGSNIWFWLEDSYIAEPSKLKPLLHTWTLAVEEQFYIIFPIMLLCVTKWARHYMLSFLCVLLLISLTLAEQLSGAYPDATFYLLHTRFWELMAGALLAKMEIDKGRISHPFLDATMPALGLFLIAHAIFTFEDTMRHPAFITAIPVIGTMIIIWFGKGGELVSDALSTRVMVGIGLISYSLYLWHYPIFAFARIEWETLSDTTKLGAIALSFLLAATSYILIERPMRYRLGLKSFAALIIIALATLAAVNIFILKTDGAKFRMAAYEGVFETGARNPTIDGKTCFEPRPNLGEHCKFEVENAKGTIIGIGDSHLAMFGPALKVLAAKHNMNYEQFPRCVFIAHTEILRLDNSIDPNPCPLEQLQELSTRENVIIVKANRLTYRITGEDIDGATRGEGFTDQYAVADNTAGVESIEDAIIATNQEILNQGHRLVQIYPVPELPFVADYRLKKLLSGYELDVKARLKDIEAEHMTTSHNGYKTRHEQAVKALDAIMHENYITIRPDQRLCTAGQCKALENGKLLYKDSNHLSTHAAEMIVQDIEAELVRKGVLQ